MGGRASRDKGSRLERAIVNDLRAAGLDARRVPLSGSMRGFKGDVQIHLAGRTLTLEAKSRASGFSFIYKAIENADLLAVKVDHAEPLLIMRLKDAAAILGEREMGKHRQPVSTTSKANRDTAKADVELDQLIVQ